MTKIKQYYVGPNQVYILAWVKDGAIIEENTPNPHSPRWVKLPDIEIRYV